MLLSSEAGPQRRHGGVAQPQCSMKESLPDIVLLLEVDRTATASSASNESRSLDHLLLMHTLVGAAVLRRTHGCSRSAKSLTATSAADLTGACRRVVAVLPP